MFRYQEALTHYNLSISQLIFVINPEVAIDKSPVYAGMAEQIPLPILAYCRTDTVTTDHCHRD